MIIKTVKRYWCEYCGKAGLSKYHMECHEAHCTLNPRRKCRVCTKLLEKPVSNLQQMMKFLPVPEDYKEDNEWGSGWHFGDLLTEAANKVLPSLRDLAEGDNGTCPVCIMAAFRQQGIPLPMVTDFDYTKEMKAVWQQINNENMRPDGYHYG